MTIMGTLDTATAPTNEAACNALEQAHFRYCGAIRELIWAIITCHPELSFPVVSFLPVLKLYTTLLLSRISISYLSGTIEHSLTCWRTAVKPHSTLPPSCVSSFTYLFT